MGVDVGDQAAGKHAERELKVAIAIDPVDHPNCSQPIEDSIKRFTAFRELRVPPTSQR